MDRLLDPMSINDTVDHIVKSPGRFWYLANVGTPQVRYDDEDVALLASRILQGTP